MCWRFLPNGTVPENEVVDQSKVLNRLLPGQHYIQFRNDVIADMSQYNIYSTLFTIKINIFIFTFQSFSVA
jgi:hypothetical protein